MDTLLLASVGLLLILVIAWFWLAKPFRERDEQEPIVPEGITLRAQPLMTKAEVSFYNALRLTVQERYLVFAQVPVWCLVEVRSDNPDVRAAFLNKIALRRVDFVLVHPGTLAAVRVVELRDPSQLSVQREARDLLVDTLFKEAGIAVVRPKAGMTYTVAALANLLGFEPPAE